MKNQTTRTMALVRMALLVAVELIMAVTPLGYLRTDYKTGQVRVVP